MTPPPLPYKIAVLCDLRDEQNRLLMLHRKKAPNRDLYSPIGGKLDTHTGESPAQCAQREIMEEAGLDIPIDRLRLAGVISESSFENEAHWLMFYYRVQGPVDLVPFEMREGRLEWIAQEDLWDLPLPATDRFAIWPTVRDHAPDGFFCLHVDCSGEEITWNVEQSAPHAFRGV